MARHIKQDSLGLLKLFITPTMIKYLEESRKIRSRSRIADKVLNKIK